MKENTLIPEENVSSVNNIYQKIEQKGRVDAQAILEAGHLKKEEMIASMLEEFNDDYQKAIEKTRQQLEHKIRSLESKFEQRTRQNRLIVQKELINQVFEQVLAKFKAFNDQQFSALVVQLIKQERIKGIEEICVAKDDYSRFVRLFSNGRRENGKLVLDRLNQLLSDPKYRLTLSDRSVNIKGGLQIIGEHFDIDLSFESLFEELKKNHETELSDILFSEGGLHE